mmetsp:Transcript_117007/g.342693  ORF Transcript_117007/g.342693 Transcript_117007/m.342693 type:complete len:252 (+) Transcript_117007:477-1232(+)
MYGVHVGPDLHLHTFLQPLWPRPAAAAGAWHAMRRAACPRIHLWRSWLRQGLHTASTEPELVCAARQHLDTDLHRLVPRIGLRDHADLAGTPGSPLVIVHVDAARARGLVDGRHIGVDLHLHADLKHARTRWATEAARPPSHLEELLHDLLETLLSEGLPEDPVRFGLAETARMEAAWCSIGSWSTATNAACLVILASSLGVLQDLVGSCRVGESLLCFGLVVRILVRMPAQRLVSVGLLDLGFRGIPLHT